MLRRLGVEVVRANDETVFELKRLRLIRDQRIDAVLDVGANRGQWARQLRRQGYAGRILSFEPLADAFVELERAAAGDPAWECRRVALGEADGEAELHVAGNSTSSSLLPMLERHRASAPESAYTGSEPVPAARLDTIAPAGDRPFLKLDVQGYELSVLRGGERTLARVRAAECELSLVPLYEGQALLTEVVAELDESGLALVALERGFREPGTGRLLQLNGLFVRVDAPAR
jgi:FkbM family methyltransferase